MVKMKQTNIRKQEIKLIGICVRTSYQEELDKMKGKVFPCVMRFFHESLFNKIPNRANPGATFCAYTDYENNDHTRAYTYFIGEEVTSFENFPQAFEKLVIPPQNYAVFTTNPAPMPDVVVNTWKSIWEMQPKELGGKRACVTDFEVYDERAADHQNIVMDVYVGIKPLH